MTMKTLKLALAAVAVLGVGAATAQEMGAAPAAPVATPAASTSVVPVASSATSAVVQQQNASNADAPLSINEIVTKDDGEKIVEEAQKTPPAEIVPKNANDAMVKWVEDHGYEQGFNDARGYFLQIGVARDNSLDPLDEDFMTKREMLYREAQLRAKVDISGLVDREVNGRNWKEGLSADDVRQFEAKYARDINEMNEMKRKVAKLMLAMEAAETECLKGVTATDRLNTLVDKVIKKLDRSFDAGQIADDKKARYDEIKKAYTDAKAAADELEQKKIDMFPSQTMNAKIDMTVRIKLHGAIPLHQMESLVGNEFQVAVAMIWSPKLEDRAAKMLARGEIAKGNPTEDRTLGEYLKANREALSAMVGARQYIDKNGKLYFIGISSQEIPKDAVEKDEAITFADQMAMQAVVMSLFVEGKGVTSAQAALAKRKGRSGDSMKALAENMEESTPKDLSVGGLGKVYSLEAEYPITRKPIYISVAAIDSTLASRSAAIKRAWDVRANDTVRTLHAIAGERQGAEEAFDAAKNSKTEFNAARAKARGEIEEEVNRIRGKQKQGSVNVTPVAPVGTPTPERQGARQGIFGGNAGHSDDF